MTHPPRIPLAAVIGAPVAHSKSPTLFRHWFDAYGIAGHYVPIHVEQKDLDEVLKTLPRLGFVGCNVTIPHKEQVLELADTVTDRASQIGAANTLTFHDGGFEADNTDGIGFIENLRQNAPTWDPTSGPAVVLGAGGAARGILSALLEAGVPDILIANRTRERAEQLSDVFGAQVKVVDWTDAPDALGQGRVVINTTSLGMIGKAPLELPLDTLHDGQLVTDIVYTPLETDLLKTAKAKGCQTVDGLGMLLHQAVPGFTRWFGTRPEVTEDTRKAVLG
ncbi:shikimate dehydrogenase [Pseudooceanicola sp. MF1-13]|uniref:shikimate dehydrogenase n=1 Tax=Pseudooceanicola sp. MF1-13 TaxID=3379095 RepID=UPI003891C50D